MATSLEALQEKVVELQATVDAEQQQVADAIAARDAAIAERDAVIVERDALIAAQAETIAALEAQIEILSQNPTPDQVAEVVASLEAVKADLEGTV